MAKQRAEHATYIYVLDPQKQIVIQGPSWSDQTRKRKAELVSARSRESYDYYITNEHKEPENWIRKKMRAIAEKDLGLKDLTGDWYCTSTITQ